MTYVHSPPAGQANCLQEKANRTESASGVIPPGIVPGAAERTESTQS